MALFFPFYRPTTDKFDIQKTSFAATQVCKSLPWTFGGKRCLYVDLLMRNRVLKTDASRTEADAAVGITAWRAILKVAAYGAAYGSQLTTDLVMPPSMEVYLDEVIPVGMSDDTIIEHRFLSVRAFAVVGETFVLLLVADKIMLERGLL